MVRRGDGELSEVPVEELVIGDIVVVKPNERLAADGFVVAGRSSVNQAPVTGESAPVDKEPVPDRAHAAAQPDKRSEEHTSELQTLMRTPAADFCLKKKHT